MKQYSRRDFLKLSALGLGALAFRPFYGAGENISQEMDSDRIVRVAINSVSIYKEPDDTSQILYTRYRDELINVYDELVSDKGPNWNPIWYRVWRGYVHSPRLQPVQYRFNPVPTSINDDKQLIEITVPFTQSMRKVNGQGWTPMYRLYYESIHWVVAIEEGPDGNAWYRVKDELLDSDSMDYHIPAQHARLIQPEELTPISPELDYNEKRIEVSLLDQTLIAYEKNVPVLTTKISSGINYKPKDLPEWNTPRGDFRVVVKMPSKHMGDGQYTPDLNAYELPGVPWSTFFTTDGIAFHGTYWHNNFGNRMSHGCINMKTEEAKWIFRWVKPEVKEIDWDTKGYGTSVLIY